MPEGEWDLTAPIGSTGRRAPSRRAEIGCRRSSPVPPCAQGPSGWGVPVPRATATDPTGGISRGYNRFFPMPESRTSERRERRTFSGIPFHPHAGGDARMPQQFCRTLHRRRIPIRDGRLIRRRSRGRGGDDSPVYCYSVLACRVSVLERRTSRNRGTGRPRRSNQFSLRSRCADRFPGKKKCFSFSGLKLSRTCVPQA